MGRGLQWWDGCAHAVVGWLAVTEALQVEEEGKGSDKVSVGRAHSQPFFSIY